MKNRKALLIAVCTFLIVAVSATGVIAYLVKKTESVTNTFTAGELLDDPLNFVLKEHSAADADKDGVYTLDLATEVESNTYTVLPGVDLPKDPFVKTTETLKLDAYVFVEVLDESGTNVHFAVDSGKWTELAGKTGPKGGKVYVMKANGGIVEEGTMLEPISILSKNADGKEITVDDAAITDLDAQYGGDIKFYGYMIQAGGFADCTAAWNGFAGSGI